MPNAKTAGERQESIEDFHIVLYHVFACDALRRRKPETVTMTESMVVAKDTMLSESTFALAWAELDDAEWAADMHKLRVLGGHGLEPEICS